MGLKTRVNVTFPDGRVEAIKRCDWMVLDYLRRLGGWATSVDVVKASLTVSPSKRLADLVNLGLVQSEPHPDKPHWRRYRAVHVPRSLFAGTPDTPRHTLPVEAEFPIPMTGTEAVR